MSSPIHILCGPSDIPAAVLSLKDPMPENKKALETIAKSIKEKVGEKWTYGWCVEDSNKAIAIAAWDSMEVCYFLIMVCGIPVYLMLKLEPSRHL